MINDLKALIYGIFISLHINTDLVTTVAILMGIDTFFGVLKVFNINYKEFSTVKLFIGWLTKIGFLLLPLTIAYLGKALNYDLSILVTISLKLLAVSESISIITNMIAIKTKKKIENYDIVTKFLNYVRNLFIEFGNLLLKWTNKK